jgi:hypothetical protein
LWNVLTGEMSLVGPRPIVESEQERYGEDLEYYLETKPGMTGLVADQRPNDTGYGERGLSGHLVREELVALDGHRHPDQDHPRRAIDPSHHMDCLTSTSRHSATSSRSSAPHHPPPPAAPPEAPAPETPAPPPNAPIADSSGPGPDAEPDLAGTQILVLSLYYWPERAGSAPPVQQMAEALARLGAKVTVLTARPAYPEMSVYPEYRNGARDRETHQGVTIRRIPIASYTPGGSLVTRLTTEGHFALRAWWSLLRMPRPDRLVTVCPSILAIAAGVLGAPRVPCHLAIVHDLQSGLAKSLEMTRVPVLASLITWLERQTLNRVDRIVTLSQGMVEAIRAIGVKTPIDIIPPTVDDTLIRIPCPSAPVPSPRSTAATSAASRAWISCSTSPSASNSGAWTSDSSSAATAITAKRFKRVRPSGGSTASCSSRSSPRLSSPRDLQTAMCACTPGLLFRRPATEPIGEPTGALIIPRRRCRASPGAPRLIPL